MRSAILAGGHATRFGGKPKGLEKVGGERILDRVAQAVRAATGGSPPLRALSMIDCRLLPRPEIRMTIGRRGVSVVVIAAGMPGPPYAVSAGQPYCGLGVTRLDGADAACIFAL